MALFEKLVGAAEPKIGVHAFAAALREWQDGAVNRQGVIDAFGLDVDDEADLDWLKAQYVDKAEKSVFIDTLESVLILAEQGYFGYATRANFVARITGLS